MKEEHIAYAFNNPYLLYGHRKYRGMDRRFLVDSRSTRPNSVCPRTWCSSYSLPNVINGCSVQLHQIYHKGRKVQKYITNEAINSSFSLLYLFGM